METVLLTGATGFLGSHLLERLTGEGYRVLVIKRSFSNTWRINHLLSRAKFYDIDGVSLKYVFEENNIDIVIHTATKYGKKGEYCAEIIESNLLFPVTLLELSVSHNTKIFINTDSFFNTDNLKYEYLNWYSLSKHQFIEWLKLFSDKIQIVNLKLEHLYGPGDSDDKFVIWLIKKCIENEPEIKLTEGQQKRDFIYVSDAVDAFILILKKRKLLPNYSTFEVGTGDNISIKDFALLVKNITSDISGKEVNTFLNFGAIPYRKGELMESRADNTSLRQLGWNCSVGLKEGLKKTIKDLLDTREMRK
jgi:nucleoside-diphosphate-sugar epimerase